MRTLYTTLVTVLLVGFIYGQEFTLVSNVSSVPNSTSNPLTSLRNFTSEIINQKEFEYRDFLRESKKSTLTFRIGTVYISKEKLTKLLRKESVYSETFIVFKKRLLDIDETVFSNFTSSQLELLYTRLRSNSKRRYLNELPNIL